MVHQTYSLSAASHQKAEAGWVVGDPEWACDMGLELGQLWPKQSMKELMGSPRVDSSSPCQDATTPQYSSISIQQLMVQRYRWAKG
ncbi:unnamed protein product [Arctogadus glacialis]